MRFINIKKTIKLFGKQQGGVSAVEFAIIFPVMMVMLLGCVSIGQAITLQRKLTLLSRSLADIVAQSSTVTDTELDNLLSAGSMIVAPFSDAPLSMSIVSIWKDEGGSSKVDWSKSKNAFIVNGSPMAIPSDTPVSNGGSVIAARVSYPYKVPFGEKIFGETINLSSETYMKPRLTTRISKTS